MRGTILTRWLTPGLLLGCFFTLLVEDVAAADWAHWRGPLQTGVSPDTNLPAKWSDDPKAPVNFLWKVPHGCRSTPIVLNGRVCINNQVGEGVNEQERVMCLDAVKGTLLWEKKFNVFHTDIVSVRLGWTNMVGDPKTGHVYWHGTQGFLVCFDKDGKILWQKSLVEEYGRISGYGGRLPSPVLAGDLVILGMVNSSWGDQARPGNRFLALNKVDGTPVWWSEPGNPTGATYYSTPTVATINGQELLISGGADGAIHALQVGTGKKVWSYYFCQGAVNASPTVDGNLVYCNHGEESPGTNEQGRILCVDAGTVKDGKPHLLWEKDGVGAKYSSPLIHGGRLYIADDVAKLWCFDAKSGKKLWDFPYGRNAMASPVWGDGKIYIADKNAMFHILEPGDKACKRLDKHFFPGADGIDVETYANAAIANGRVYFATRDETYCIGTKDAKSGEVKAAKGDIIPGKPAQLLIYPADLTMKADADRAFGLKAYDESGNFVRTVTYPAKVQWGIAELPVPAGKPKPPPLVGRIYYNLEVPFLKVAKEAASQQGYVGAEWNGLKATARVRVAPTLPYAVNFKDVAAGTVPGGWINAQGKFVVKKLTDDSHVLGKVTNSSNALIARGPCFIGTPEMTNYTIEAEVFGGKQVSKDEAGKEIVYMPHVGLGACRYTLILDGPTQALRLVSWDAMPRVDQTIGFEWQANTWYNMKLSAEVAGGKTVLRGKVWPWGQKEPEAWTVEYTDPTPNLEGAPFLYGYVLGHQQNDTVPGAEVWFDNVRVTPNKK